MTPKRLLHLFIQLNWPGCGHFGQRALSLKTCLAGGHTKVCGPQHYANNSSQRWASTFSSDRDWTLDDVASHLLKEDTENVVVMAGAGISTPSGIPDFRSPGSGLYDNLKQYNLPYPEAIFELNYFHSNPKPFFSLAQSLYPGHYKPNAVHYFCRLLKDKNKLLRMYTQNIDGLERLAGLPPDKLVEAHGSFATATCLECSKTYDGGDIKQDIMDGKIPRCSSDKCQGTVKPDIVFFGELLPERFYMHVQDMEKADLLLVMGTSLEVEPFASIANLVDETVPRVLINKTPVRSFVTSDSEKDVLILGDVVQNVNKLVQQLGWTEELLNLINSKG